MLIVAAINPHGSRSLKRDSVNIHSVRIKSGGVNISQMP